MLCSLFVHCLETWSQPGLRQQQKRGANRFFCHFVSFPLTLLGFHIFVSHENRPTGWPPRLCQEWVKGAYKGCRQECVLDFLCSYLTKRTVVYTFWWCSKLSRRCSFVVQVIQTSSKKTRLNRKEIGSSATGVRTYTPLGNCFTSEKGRVSRGVFFVWHWKMLWLFSFLACTCWATCAIMFLSLPLLTHITLAFISLLPEYMAGDQVFKRSNQAHPIPHPSSSPFSNAPV